MLTAVCDKLWGAASWNKDGLGTRLNFATFALAELGTVAPASGKRTYTTRNQVAVVAAGAAAVGKTKNAFASGNSAPLRIALDYSNFFLRIVPRLGSRGKIPSAKEVRRITNSGEDF